jgi:hypothetical protein
VGRELGPRDDALVVLRVVQIVLDYGLNQVFLITGVSRETLSET